MIRRLFDRSFRRWSILHPFLRFLIVGILLAAIGFVSVKPAYRAFKQWRMDRNLAAAKVAVVETRMLEARDLSLTVMRSGNSSIETFRILEAAMAALGDPRHLQAARALITHPQGTAEDRVSGFRTLVKDTPLGIAFQAWTGLPPESHTQAAFVMPLARRLLDEKRFDLAIEILLLVPAEARDAALHQDLARVIIRRGLYAGFGEIQHEIAMELDREDADIPGWLAVLEEMPVASLRQEILGSLRHRLPEWPDLDPARSGLLQARLDYAWRWHDRAAILDDAIAAWKDKAPRQLARFLTDLAYDKRLLDTFSEAPAQSDPELLPLLLDAAHRSGDLERMAALLDSSGASLPKFLTLSYRALMTAGSADNTAGNEAWRAAIAEARADTSGQALLTLHRMAHEAGLDEPARMAMIAAIRSRSGPLPLYEDLKPLLDSLRRSGQQTTLLDIAAVYLSFEPWNPTVLADYAYLACVLNTVAPAMLLPPLEKMTAAFPREFNIHLTHAVVLISDGQHAKAAAALAPFDLENQELPPASLAVFLAIADYAFLACLQDPVAPAMLLPTLEKMAAAFPEELPIHLTHAIVLLSDGQHAKAAAALAPFDLENQELPPASLAVFLASELLNGRIPAGDPRILDFPWNDLSTTERRKFRAMLRPDIGP